MPTSDSSTAPYAFGDLLALARGHWVAAMATRLDELGYPDYRRSDAAVLRLLAHGPSSISHVGEVLGVSRQAARKVVDALVSRGFAIESREPGDARQARIELSEAGRAYAEAVRATIASMNVALAAAVTPEQLAAADAVLRASIVDPSARARAERLVARPPR